MAREEAAAAAAAREENADLRAQMELLREQAHQANVLVHQSRTEQQERYAALEHTLLGRLTSTVQ